MTIQKFLKQLNKLNTKYLHDPLKNELKSLCNEIINADFLTKQQLRKLFADKTDETQDTLFHLIAETNLVGEAEALYQKYNTINLNAYNSDNKSPIHIAAENNAVEMIAWLISKGVNPDTIVKNCYKTPLYLAIQHNFSEALNALVKDGADMLKASARNVTPLYYAVMSERPEMVKTMISHIEFDSLSCEQKNKLLSCLHAALSACENEAVKLMLNFNLDINSDDFNDGLNALHIAALSRNPEGLKMLLQHESINVNHTNRKDGNSALHYAILENNTFFNAEKNPLAEQSTDQRSLATLITLFQYKLDEIELDSRNNKQHSALNIAVAGCRYMTTKLILQGRIYKVKTLLTQAETKTSNQTAFNLLENPELLKTIDLTQLTTLEFVNHKGNYSNTALHLAATTGDYRVASLLCSVSDIDIKIKNSEGLTPLQVALRLQHYHLILYLFTPELKDQLLVEKDIVSAFDRLIKNHSANTASAQDIKLLINLACDCIQEKSNFKKITSAIIQLNIEEVFTFFLELADTNSLKGLVREMIRESMLTSDDDETVRLSLFLSSIETSSKNEIIRIAETVIRLAQDNKLSDLNKLHKAGIKLDITDSNGDTLIHHALKSCIKIHEAKPILDFFIHIGLNFLLANNQGKTPLLLARTEAITLYLLKGLDVRLPEETTEKIVMKAASKQWHETIIYLLSKLLKSSQRKIASKALNNLGSSNILTQQILLRLGGTKHKTSSFIINATIRNAQRINSSKNFSVKTQKKKRPFKQLERPFHIALKNLPNIEISWPNISVPGDVSLTFYEGDLFNNDAKRDRIFTLPKQQYFDLIATTVSTLCISLNYSTKAYPSIFKITINTRKKLKHTPPKQTKNNNQPVKFWQSLRKLSIANLINQAKELNARNTEQAHEEVANNTSLTTLPGKQNNIIDIIDLWNFLEDLRALEKDVAQQIHEDFIGLPDCSSCLDELNEFISHEILGVRKYTFKT